MLTSEERGAILYALQEWAEFAPDEPLLGFIQSDVLMTPTQIVLAVKENSSDGEALLENIEHVVRRQGLEAVTQRIRLSLTEKM